MDTDSAYGGYEKWQEIASVRLSLEKTFATLILVGLGFLGFLLSSPDSNCLTSPLATFHTMHKRYLYPCVQIHRASGYEYA